MTKTAARLLLALPGLFILLTGLMFLVRPEAAADKLQLTVQGAESLSNLRGLAGAPLFAVGTSLLLSAITSKLEYARPAAIFLLTLLGARVASYLLDGPIDAIGLFLAIPATAFALMVAGHKLLDRAHDEERVAPKQVVPSST